MLAAADRRADHAGGVHFALAVAAAQRAVAHHVAGQHRLAFAQHGGGQESRARGDRALRKRVREATISRSRGRSASAFEIARQQQQRAGVDLRFARTAGQGHVGQRSGCRRPWPARTPAGRAWPRPGRAAESPCRRRRPLRAARETCVWPRRCVIVAGSSFASTSVVVADRRPDRLGPSRRAIGRGRSSRLESGKPWPDRGRRPVATGRCG